VVLMGFVSTTVAAAPAWCLAWGARAVFAVVRILAAIPHAAVYTSNPVFVLWLGFVYALLLSTWLLRDRKDGYRPAFPTALALSALCAVVLLTRWTESRAGPRLEVLDVGQGACSVLRDGSAVIMVDCGGHYAERNAGDTAAQHLLGRCIPRVDALLLTHLHSDHVNGVTRFLSQVEVTRILLPTAAPDDQELLASIREAAGWHGTELEFLREDAEVCVGDIRLRVYAPGPGNTDNERGLILWGSVGGLDVLFTGDAGTERERQFLADAGSPELDVLLVGHHGSRYSTGERLLEAVSPELAVISVGWNPYGHPAEETLLRLEEHETEVLRTDVLGTVTIGWEEESHGARTDGDPGLQGAGA